MAKSCANGLPDGGTGSFAIFEEALPEAILDVEGRGSIFLGGDVKPTLASGSPSWTVRISPLLKPSEDKAASSPAEVSRGLGGCPMRTEEQSHTRKLPLSSLFATMSNPYSAVSPE